MILFVFEVKRDAEHVLAMEPWTFDKHLVLLQKYDGSCPVRNFKFLNIKFWIQLHGLLVNRLNWKTAIEVGKLVRCVFYLERKGDMIGSDFLQVRAEIDVSKPHVMVGKFCLTVIAKGGCHSNTKNSKLLLLV